MAVFQGDVHERVQQRVRQQMRLQAKVDQFGVLCVVVVILGFDARVLQVINLHGQAEFFAGGHNHYRKVADAELLRELVVDAAFSASGRIFAGNFDAADRVANIEEAPRLAALAVNCERLPDRCLNTESVQDRAEDVVIVETIDERLIHGGFVGHRSVDYTLVEIRSTQTPNFAAEHDVVAVVNFREVIEGARLLRKWQYVFPSIMLDGDISLFDVDVRCAVFTHGSKLNQVAVGTVFAKGEQ